MPRRYCVTEESLAKYRYPENRFIGRGPTTERLYTLEERAAKALRAAAEELAHVLNISSAEFWTRTLAEALRSQLEHWDQEAAFQAARSYVESHGATVTLPAHPAD